MARTRACRVGWIRHSEWNAGSNYPGWNSGCFFLCLPQLMQIFLPSTQVVAVFFWPRLTHGPHVEPATGSVKKNCRGANSFQSLVLPTPKSRKPLLVRISGVSASILIRFSFVHLSLLSNTSTRFCPSNTHLLPVFLWLTSLSKRAFVKIWELC